MTTADTYLRASLTAPEGCDANTHALLSGAQRILDGGAGIILDHAEIERRIGPGWKTMAANHLFAAADMLSRAARSL